MATILSGDRIKNPGNGTYQWWPQKPINAVQIVQADPAIPLAGVLVFSVGAAQGIIDLAAGGRSASLYGGPLKMLDVEISGVSPTAEFTLFVS